MNSKALIYVGISVACLSCASAKADQFTLPEEIGRIESPRDMNIFAVEPTVIDERYYTRGGAERHQFVGNVLPAGAPIPDNDAPIAVGVVKHKPSSLPAASVTAPTVTPAATPAVSPHN